MFTLPWHIYLTTGVAPCGAWIRDRNGRNIGYFADYRAAQQVIDLFDTNKNLREDIIELEHTIEELSTK